jgi:hypothetical protein
MWGLQDPKRGTKSLGQRGFELAWLTVRPTNFIAIKLYRKLGFAFCDKDNHERVMGIKLGSLLHGRFRKCERLSSSQGG